MKLAYLTTIYPIYMQKLYGVRTGLAQEPFEQQRELIESDAFGWADFWQKALLPLGYQVYDVLANVQPLQWAWAKENGFTSYAEDNWVFSISMEQIRRFQPDILFIDDYHTFSAAWIAAVRRCCPSIRLVLGWCGAPYRDGSVFAEYDVVLSCVPELVKDFANQGHASYHMNHGFDPRILTRLENKGTSADIDFSFIGQIMLANNYHVKRAQLLTALVQQVKMEIYSPMFESPSQIEQLRPFLRPSVFGLEMFNTLKRSKLTFNSHIDVSANSASNMRLFEATGMGTCLVTDWKQNISTLFVPDQEVVTYKSVEECVEKVKWLQAHPAEAKRIGAAGQQKTLRQHTYGLRALELDKVIRTALEKNVRSISQRRQAEQNQQQYGYFGDYKSWDEACKDSAGYDAANILEKVKMALLKVKRGEAVYERDSVLFDKPQYSWPLLAALLWCAGRNGNRLNLIDYGGSLGSSYFQNRRFLQHLAEVRWNIIEQPNFVECGKQYFADEQLKFYNSLEEVAQAESPTVILLSSVLQYFDDPYAYLQRIIDAGYHTVIFDRTPFLLSGESRLMVQKVPPDIYDASYPAWFLNLQQFLAFMSEKYELIADFAALDRCNVANSQHLGLVFERKAIDEPLQYYCTLFDSNYLTRGLVMYESLCKSGEAFHLYIACFDELAYDILAKMNLSRVTLVQLAELEDEELLKVKPERSKGEYCWTCTSSVIKYCLERFGLPEITYVDADLYFFQKPSILLREFYRSGCSVSLSPHNYSPVYQWQAKTSGIYCVQFMTFKADPQGMKILSWWRDKCIDWCFSTFDQENDRFGDQKYLDKWTEMFEGIHVLQNPGAGAAPWNIQACKIGDGPKVNDCSTVFYHFHGFKWLNDNRVILAGNYLLEPNAIAVFYQPYIKEMQKQTLRVLQVDAAFPGARTQVADKDEEIRAPKTLLFKAYIE